jgi:hypothetical protein
MGRLSATDARQFEDHYLTCSQCAASAEQAEWFVRAMKNATRRSRADPGNGQPNRA